MCFTAQCTAPGHGSLHTITGGDRDSRVDAFPRGPRSLPAGELMYRSAVATQCEVSYPHPLVRRGRYGVFQPAFCLSHPTRRWPICSIWDDMSVAVVVSSMVDVRVVITAELHQSRTLPQPSPGIVLHGAPDASDGVHLSSVSFCLSLSHRSQGGRSSLWCSHSHSPARPPSQVAPHRPPASRSSPAQLPWVTREQAGNTRTVRSGWRSPSSPRPRPSASPLPLNGRSSR